MKKFSIIIPIYNCERFIERCVYSVLNQTYENYEVFLIDDGSSDNSLLLCNKFEAEDPRIKVFSQVNQGPGAARNLGMEKASGDYLIFIDSDDYIDLDYLKNINRLLEYGTVDLIFCGFKFEDQMTGEILAEIKLPERSYCRREFPQIIKTLIDSDMFGYSWCKVVSNEIVKKNKLSFDKTYSLHEDLIFACELCSVADSLAVLGTSSYHYIKGSNTLCTKFRTDIMENMEYVNIKVFNFYEKIKIDDIDKMIIQRAVFSMFLILKNATGKSTERISKSSYKEFINGKTVQEIRKRRNYYSESVAGKKKWIIYMICMLKSSLLLKVVTRLYAMKVRRSE